MENKPELKIPDLEAKKPATLRLPFDPQKPPVPQIDGKAAAGTIIVTNGELELIVDRIYAPFLGQVEGVIEVTGNSMEPTFVSGARIAITRIDNYEKFDWGKCYYIIDKNRQGVIRRVCMSEYRESIMLVCDHPNKDLVPPLHRRLDNILTMFQVIAGITRQ